jgi:hypothetical protein
MVSF